MQPIGIDVGVSTDITRRHQAEETQRDSEALYHSLVECLPQNIIRKDREGRFTFGNKNFFTTIGKSQSEVIGKTDFDLFPEELARKYRQDDLKVMETGKTFEAIEEHQPPNGEQIYVQVVKTPVYDARGEIIGTQGIFWDVTERKRAEEAVRRAELQFRLVWENSVDGMRLTNEEGVIVMVNDAFCRMVGKRKEDLEQKLLSVIYASEQQAHIQNQHQERFRTSAIKPRLEREITLWNGNKIWFELSNSMLEIAGRPPLLLSIFRDITARKRSEAWQAGHNRVLEMLTTEKTLMEALHTLVRVVEEQAPGMICSILLLDKEGKRLRHGAAPSLPEAYNRAVDGITIGPEAGSCGTAAYRGECVIVEDIESHPLWDKFRAVALPYGLRSCWSQPILSARGQVLGTFAMYYKRPGKPSPAERKLIEGAARLAGITIERKRSETELQETLQKLELANAELAELSRTKSEFLANTSHELRTPLTSIIGYLNLVIDGLTDSPEEVMDFVRTARDSSRHLLTLINDVLDLAKIEAGKMTIPIEDVNLNNALIEAHALTHVQATQKKILLQVDRPEVEILVRANADKLKQVLLNLIGNAIKFTKHGSVTVSARIEDVFIRISVKDTGIGIDKEVQKRLFQPFVQADGSTTRRFGGTGLGLAITKSLVEKMGGQINLISEGEGKGSVVEFTLPLSAPAVPSRPEAQENLSAARASTSKIKVLIAEDDPATVRFIERILSKDKYEVNTAHNGAHALDYLARTGAVEVLILDLMMPNMSGYDVLTMLKHRFGAPPPVVIVTNYADNVSPDQQQLLESSFIKAVIPKAQVYEKLPSYLESLFATGQSGEVA